MFRLIAVIAFIFALVLNLAHVSLGAFTDFTAVIVGLLCLALDGVDFRTYVRPRD